jgi:hypothetical protein
MTPEPIQFSPEPRLVVNVENVGGTAEGLQIHAIAIYLGASDTPSKADVRVHAFDAMNPVRVRRDKKYTRKALIRPEVWEWMEPALKNTSPQYKLHLYVCAEYTIPFTVREEFQRGAVDGFFVWAPGGYWTMVHEFKVAQLVARIASDVGASTVETARACSRIATSAGFQRKEGESVWPE